MSTCYQNNGFKNLLNLEIEVLFKIGKFLKIIKITFSVHLTHRYVLKQLPVGSDTVLVVIRHLRIEEFLNKPSIVERKRVPPVHEAAGNREYLNTCSNCQIDFVQSS